MKFRLLISVALMLAVPSVSLAAEIFGVASTDGKVACITTVRTIQSLPLRVEIVVPDTPQRVLSGTITSSLREPCAALASADLPGPFFALRLAPDGELSPGELGIVSFGSSHALAFRSCTSTEGVHLTVLADKPLKRKRIWHEYVYLGYDVEPSCSDQDFGEVR